MTSKLPEGPFDCVYVSPHLHDVAFSCAAKVLADRRLGRRVLVLTVYSSAGPRSSPSAFGAFQKAHDQDVAAMARLGVQRAQMDRVEATFRSPAYQSFVGQTQGWDRRDRHEVTQLGAELKTFFATIQATEIYAPLGIGGHVDSRICHEAVRRAVDGMPLTTKVAFYEERPAALVREATSLRLTDLNWQAALPLAPSTAQRAREFFSDFFASPYVQSAALSQGDRLRVMARYGFLVARSASSDWLTEAIIYHFGTGLFDTVAPIVACYPDTLDVAFGGPKEWRRLSQHYHRRLGYPNRYIERLWTLPVRFES